MCDVAKKIFLFHFKVHLNFNSLSEVNKKNVWYCSKLVHGMLFRDHYTHLDKVALIDIMLDLISICKNEDKLIAYNGGHIEKDLLHQLGASNISYDLKKIGVPKFEKLYKDPYLQSVVLSFKKFLIDEGKPLDQKLNRNCWLHKRTQNKAPLHCSMVEVAYFAAFILTKL